MTLTIGQMSDTNEDNWASVKDTETDKCMHIAQLHKHLVTERGQTNFALIFYGFVPIKVKSLC